MAPRRSLGWWCALGVVALIAACSAGDDDSARPVSGDDASTTSAPASTSSDGARPAAGFPAQPDGVPFPTDEWPEGEWPAGLDRTAVDRVVDTSFAGGGSPRVRAVLVVHGGKIVYERYSPNRVDGRSVTMPGFSMAKSVTSALAGILVRDGRLDVDAPAAVGAWQGVSDPRHAITLDHLLHMTSGLNWTERPHDADMFPMLAADDGAAYAADKELVTDPGTRFLYSTGDTMLVSGILADEVGAGGDFRKFVDAELLGRIGVGRADMEFDPSGTWYGGVSFETTARNFAKFGLLYLRDGVWDGERILPEGWVDYSRSAVVANSEYGAGWWLDPERPGVMYAVGVDGQVITVDPVHDLTFVQLATDDASDISLAVSEAILDAFAAGGGSAGHPPGHAPAPPAGRR
jgi:CubicO group peptidase (beta-lactamase class C family)